MTLTFSVKARLHVLTLGNHAVHKSHGEAEEDEVMQVVHLEDETNVFTF